MEKFMKLADGSPQPEASAGHGDLAESGDASLVTCFECKLEVPKNKAQKQGRSTNIKWKCNPCNAMTSRVNAATRASSGLKNQWGLLTAEEKKEFKEIHGHLGTSDMAQEMKAFITMKKVSKSSSFKGNKGKGKPLSVFRHEGYSEEQLESIEKHADKEWDELLQSYVYYVDIKERGQNEEESFIKESLFEGPPVKKKRVLTPHASETSEASVKKKKKSAAKKDSNSSEKAEGEEGGQEEHKQQKSSKKAKKSSNKKPAKLSMASKVAKKKKEAKALVGSIAPALAQLNNLINQKFTQEIKEKIPNYILEETSQMLKTLKKCNTHYLAVLNGNCADEGQYSNEDVTKKLEDAEQAIKKAHMMIDVAEGKKL